MTTEHDKPQPQYSLSLQDFSQLPSEINQFRIGDMVTRNSFSSWIATTFRMSQGSEDMQKIYLDWERVHYGHNWRQTLTNFMLLDGPLAQRGEGIYPDMWRHFTGEEQDHFRQLFVNVQRHEEYETQLMQKPWTPELIEDVITTQLGKTLFLLTTSKPENINGLSDEQLARMNVSELSSHIHEHRYDKTFEDEFGF